MISHKKQIIFIHIPKCAGSSIKDFYFDNPKLNWKVPNYDLLYGWCPQRKIHLQHATSKQLLETGLISKKIWDTYFKFTFVRNPYDRTYSDYLWMMKDRKLKGSFKDYILKKGVFKKVLLDRNKKDFRGDHLIPQTDFFDFEGKYALDFMGKFENLKQDIAYLNTVLGQKKEFTHHAKKNSKRLSHYSQFYTGTRKKLVEREFLNDIQLLGYSFEEKKSGIQKFKNWL